MPDAFDVDPRLRVDAPDWYRTAIATPFERRNVDVDGCRINYLEWLPDDTDRGADRGAGTGLVFVHGGSAHAHWWTHIAATFRPWLHCVAIDLSGHGDSGRRDAYTLEIWTDEVAAVAEHAGIVAPIVVGHSMGGFVTIATAARHPDALAGAVIVDSPVFEHDAEVTAARSRPTFDTPRTYATVDEVVGRFRTLPPQEHYLDYVIDHVARRSIREVDGGWRWKFDNSFWHAMGGDPSRSALAFLGQIACRVALFRCEEGLVDIDIGRFMFDRMGRATPVVELPTAGHHPMLDQPLVLITALRTLLADWIHSDPRRPRRRHAHPDRPPDRPTAG